jgi:hypothetical protein
MLSIAIVEQIDRLLKDGQVSQRKIAKQLGVSRGTVAAIASGRRGLYGKEPDSLASASLTPHSPPVRCPECGCLIYMPCLVCRARNYRQQRKLLRILLAASRTTPRSRCPTAADHSVVPGHGSRHARVA